jgi:hypothetical protein
MIFTLSQKRRLKSWLVKRLNLLATLQVQITPKSLFQSKRAQRTPKNSWKISNFSNYFNKSKNYSRREVNNKRNKKILTMNQIAMMKNKSFKNKKCINLLAWLLSLSNRKTKFFIIRVKKYTSIQRKLTNYRKRAKASIKES